MWLMLLKVLISWLMSLGLGSALAPVVTLGSLEQVQDYPLYVMHSYGDPARNLAIAEAVAPRLDVPASDAGLNAAAPGWACSLYATWADPAHALYGRNFDWQYSPAVLLIHYPPDGYASISMVDIAYLGFASTSSARTITDLPLIERTSLLLAPQWPLDGMNEYGLTIALAAIPYADQTVDPSLPTIGSLGIVREVLDHARTVDETLAIFARFNIDWTGGPPLHYLVVDATGEAALVEFVDGVLVATRPAAAWHLATNFTRATVRGAPEKSCWRYRTISETLARAGGVLSMPEAMALLDDVSQPNTQWSVVYGMATGQVDVVMGRQYDAGVFTFQFPLAVLTLRPN